MELDGWLQPLIQKLSPGERKKLSRDIGRKLAASQRNRIKAQKNPDGSSFESRKEKRPLKKPISFLYRKPGGSERVGSMVSFRDEGDRMIGYDIEARGIRTFLKNRVQFYMKPRHTSGGRKMKGFVRRKAMFSKIRQAKYLYGGGTEDAAYVQFVAEMSRIAEIHQYGKTARVESGGRRVNYPKRELLGFTEEDAAMIEDTIFRHLESK